MTENEVRLLTEIDQRSKSNTHQISEIKEEIRELKAENKAIYELTTSVKLIAQDMAGIKNDLAEVKAEVKAGQKELTDKVLAIENKPSVETAANVSKVKIAVITSVATSVTTAIVMGLIAFIK